MTLFGSHHFFDHLCLIFLLCLLGELLQLSFRQIWILLFGCLNFSRNVGGRLGYLLSLSCGGFQFLGLLF